MVVFLMIYEHQINWANACNNNVDNSLTQLLQMVLIYLLFTVKLLLSIRWENSTFRKLYNWNIWTTK